MCHQTVGLTALHLESIGVPTVIIGSARDIVEELGVPRFVFTDVPLGSPLGPPGDPIQQMRVLRDALDLGVSAVRPRTTLHTPVTWPGPDDWRETYMSIADPDELARKGDERRRQAAARARQSPS